MMTNSKEATALPNNRRPLSLINNQLKEPYIWKKLAIMT